MDVIILSYMYLTMSGRSTCQRGGMSIKAPPPPPPPLDETMHRNETVNVQPPLPLDLSHDQQCPDHETCHQGIINSWLY